MAGTAATSAQAASTVPRTSVGSVSTAGALLGVAAVSTHNAWAVGYTGEVPDRKRLLLHWNGNTWQRVKGVAASAGQLTAVSATSGRHAWAVGYSLSGEDERDTGQVLQWNGHSWQKSTSIRNAIFSGVTAVTAKDVWAVGSVGLQPLFLHWNGRSWKKASHSSMPFDGVAGLAATSARSAWAVGENLSTQAFPVLYRWNGKTWKTVHSPISGTYDWLASVAAISARNVFAVGNNTSGEPGYRQQVMHWNGSTWTVSKLPAEPKGYLDGLNSVVRSTHGTAWAVGSATKGTTVAKTWILRWNGRTWTRTPSPTPTGGATLQGVAATSASNAWAVGTTTTYPTKTVLLHWNGTDWS